MAKGGEKSNRGPAAAVDNRRALLQAARRVFAERGYHAPLNSIAREAGVGQGVLYRHFPTRLDLAFAVFDDSFAELDAIAADPVPDAFTRLWGRLVDITIDTSAFLEMVTDARRSLPDYDGSSHLLTLIESTLPRAQDAGLVPAALTPEDVMLAQRMVYGVVVTAIDPDDIRRAVAQSLVLLRPHLSSESAGPPRG